MESTLLVIGNRNYSSWSLRAWLAMRKAGTPFEIRRLALDTPEFRREIARRSPSRRVPVLHHGDCVVWDSLAIAEYANETFAGGTLWPADPYARAQARSASAEMHSGFAALRARMPMNCRARDRRVAGDAALAGDIDRIAALWAGCRREYGAAGPWLFGRWSIADAVYAPVASRFLTYGVGPRGAAGDYLDTALADPDLRSWMQDAQGEEETLATEEVGL